MLEVRNLRKVYGALEAVKGISFELNPGDIFGFIGSNGAGKTTTIRMIATLLEPTGGTARLNGVDVLQDPMQIRRMIGYMPDFFGLYDDVKVWEYLDFWATVYRIPPKQRSGVIEQVLELTNLSGKREAFVQSLSRGMQQRLCLAKCLVHDPDLLLLDEPASGLDPRARAELKELILELGRMGKIIVVSSHILPELSDFCNMVGIIERGDLVGFGPVKQIVQGLRQARLITVRCLGEVNRLESAVSGDPNAASVRVGPEGEVQFDFGGNHDQQADLLARLIAEGHRILDFREEHADLEDVFLKLTTGAVN